LRGDVDEKRRDALIERFELDPTKRARTYSKGNRQKVALIAALSSSAELLLLDEPTSGLDPLMAVEFQHCIQEVRDEGRTVLLSSHILAEVEVLCDAVSIIRAGRTVQSGSLADLRHLTRTAVTAEVDAVPDGLAAASSVHGLEVDGRRIRFDVDTAQIGPILGMLAHVGVRSLVSQPPTLEELFLRQYGDEFAS
jgi:ABC-2 type transport system ATP-binding protein